MVANWGKNWEKIVSFGLFLPSLIAIMLFVYGFIGWSGWVSVSNWTRGAQADYSYGGFDSYARLFGSNEKYAAGIDARRFGAGMRNIVGFTLFFIFGCIIVGFLLAAMLDRHVIGEGFSGQLFSFLWLSPSL